ncbi:MAG: response regulator transcription factor [Chloroflexota bacterium]
MKILVIDDDPQIRDAVTVGFQFQWQDAEVLTAADGEEGLNLFFESDPDIVVLDVRMPRMTGLEVVKKIRQVSDVPIIIMTALGDETDQVRGLELGADDYVVKPFGHLALLARAKAVLRRADMAPPARAIPDFEFGGLAINFGSRQVTLDGKPVRLTPVEFKLLYHLVRNLGKVMPHEALLQRIWGDEFGRTTDHLKGIVHRLRAKIERPESGYHIETERGIGYGLVKTA